MSEKEAARKGKQIGAMFTADEVDKINAYRWDNRIDRVSDVIRAAVLEKISGKP